MPIRIRQAAAAIGVSTRVLMELEREGLIQPLRSRGGHRYFTPELIEAARRAYFTFTPKPKLSAARRETASVP